MIQPIFKNISAITYVVAFYILGVISIITNLWQLNILGVIMIAHSLVISNGLTHEFIHGNIFKSRKLNAFWGQVMTHLNGACYAPWEKIVEHHFSHHTRHVDLVRFDIMKYLNEDLNKWLRKGYVVMEWLYFPVLEFELRWRIILDPILDENRQHLLGRVIGLACYRVIAFCLLAWISWKALLLYFLAYISFVNLVRFIDAFHHTYDYVPLGQEIIQRDRVYEQANTFTNLISVKYPWLDLLFLNFGYHNAHHHNMSCPWHELPALHAKLYGKEDFAPLFLPKLIINYHRFRLPRLFSGQGEMDEEGKIKLESFTGGISVSLLTPP
jgi:fatty acid desaturase